MTEFLGQVAILIVFVVGVSFLIVRTWPKDHPFMKYAVWVVTAIGAAIGYLMDLGNGVFW